MPLPGSGAMAGQGEPGVEPQVLAVPAGGLVEGLGLRGCQGPVGPQVELHVVAGDGAPHGGEELCVDQGHPGRGLPGAWHVAVPLAQFKVCVSRPLPCGIPRAGSSAPGAALAGGSSGWSLGGLTGSDMSTCV